MERPLISGNNLRTGSLIFLMLFLSATSNTFLVSTGHDYTKERQISTLSPEILQGATLGFQYFWANIMWMQTIVYFGSHLEKSDFAYLSKLLDSVTTLNPKAEHAYYLAAAALPWSMNSTQLSKPLIERAINSLPQDWRWPYYRGFNAYWFDHDLKTAGEMLNKASKLPGVHPYILNIALRIQSESGHIDTALAFLKQLIMEKQDQHIRNKLLKQYNALLTEKVIRAVETWMKSYDFKIDNDESLRKAIRMGAPIPQQLPDGGKIIINSEREIVSSAVGKRFKVFTSPALRRKSQ